MMDLDKVHEINDRYGPAGGDQVIIAVADILKNMGRPGDIAVRLSGDEFAVLLPDTGSNDAVTVAERIRVQVMDKRVNVNRLGSDGTDELQIRASMGIAAAPEHAENVRDLMFAADRALRKAKEKGRNRTERYTVQFE
jgi:diguanylate cyclase (GGDEF)-like protein